MPATMSANNPWNLDLTLEEILAQEMQMLTIDALDKWLSLFPDLKKFLLDKGYQEIAELKAYLRIRGEKTHQDILKHTQDHNKDKILHILQFGEKHNRTEHTSQALQTLLEQKQEHYQTMRQNFQKEINKSDFHLDVARIVKNSGIDEAEVKQWLQDKANQRLWQFQMIDQGMHYLSHIPLQREWSKIFDAFPNLLGGFEHFVNNNPNHLLVKAKDGKTSIPEQVAQMKTILSEIQQSQTVSKQMIDQLKKIAYHIKIALQDYSFNQHVDLNPREENLIARSDNIQTLLDGFYSQVVEKYQDTKIADNTMKLKNLQQQKEQNAIIVEGLPSREKIVAEIHDKLQKNKNILLTGPSGTGKTELAKYAVREIIANMYQNGELSLEEYQDYSKDLLYLSGHPDATKNELGGSLVLDVEHIKDEKQKKQKWEKIMQNLETEADSQSPKFKYAYSKLEKSMMTGIPIIIDEFLRYPESLLAYMKFFWSRKPWEMHTLANGEHIPLKTVNFIATTNEWEAYGLFASDFIAREYESIHVPYIKGKELSDLVRVNLMKNAWFVPYIDPKFFMKDGAVHAMVEVADTINTLKFNGKKETFYDKVASTWKRKPNDRGKLTSAMMDTKRFLWCFDFDAGSLQTLGAEELLAKNICKYISGASSHVWDKYLLIKVFADKGLIDKTHEKYLLEYDEQTMSVKDTTWTSVVAKNISTDANITHTDKNSLTDIAHLAESCPYDKKALTKLPLTSDNIKTVEQKKLLTTMQSVYLAEDSVATLINDLLKLDEINDEQVDDLLDTIQKSWWDNPVDVMEGVNELSKNISPSLRNDPKWFEQWDKKLEEIYDSQNKKLSKEQQAEREKKKAEANKHNLSDKEIPYEDLPDHIRLMSQDIESWIAEDSAERTKYKPVIKKFKEHLTNGNITYGMHNGKLEARDNISHTAFGPPMSAPKTWNSKEWDYDNWNNLYKKLSRYYNKKNWFYDTNNTQDADLIYKNTIDRPGESEIGKEFREQLQTDIYDKGYERTTKNTYQESADALFAGMDQDMQIMGMQLMTWFMWLWWFQKEWEIVYSGEAGDKLKSNYILSWQSRSFVGSLAGYRDFSSWDYPSHGMAILSSRSIEN